MFTTRFLALQCALLLSGCAALHDENDPIRQGQHVSLINRITWTNGLTGKRDGARSAWPLKTLAGHTEEFPTGQLKQCGKAGNNCAWGVLKARRTLSQYRFVPGGVEVDMEVVVDIDRHQKEYKPGLETALTIPSATDALRSYRVFKEWVLLEYGKVHHVDLSLGVDIDLCVLRYDAARNALDRCEIPYL